MHLAYESDVNCSEVVQCSVHPPSWSSLALGPTYWFADMFAELTVWFISRDPYLGVHKSVNLLGNQLLHETSLCEKRARTYMDDCPKMTCGPSKQDARLGGWGEGSLTSAGTP